MLPCLDINVTDITYCSVFSIHFLVFHNFTSKMKKYKKSYRYIIVIVFWRKKNLMNRYLSHNLWDKRVNYHSFIEVSIIDHRVLLWSTIKENLPNIPGHLHEKNYSFIWINQKTYNQWSWHITYVNYLFRYSLKFISRFFYLKLQESDFIVLFISYLWDIFLIHYLELLID